MKHLMMAVLAAVMAGAACAAEPPDDLGWTPAEFSRVMPGYGALEWEYAPFPVRGWHSWAANDGDRVRFVMASETGLRVIFLSIQMLMQPADVLDSGVFEAAMRRAGEQLAGCVGEDEAGRRMAGDWAESLYARQVDGLLRGEPLKPAEVAWSIGTRYLIVPSFPTAEEPGIYGFIVVVKPAEPAAE